jgi:hypothetical protein
MWRKNRSEPGQTSIFTATILALKRVNLLAGFPFPDNYFDVVYSSHVLEHFTRDQGLFLSVRHIAP